MAEKTIIIIGAGLAGLSTGCYAQMNGYKSMVFEHHTVPGGVASYWRRSGYLIDGGIHFIMDHKPGTALYELYRELGIDKDNRFVDLTTYGRFIDELTGDSVDVTMDLNRLASDLKKISPDDAEVIDELISGASAMRGLDIGKVGLSRPPELTGSVQRLKEMWGMRRLFKYFKGKYQGPVAEYVLTVNNPWLQDCIKSLFLPEVPVWFIFLLLATFADGKLGLLEGGCLDFVQTIEKRYKGLGGQVRYRATVEEILVENDRAVGIRLADGTEHTSDIVVSAADGYGTIFRMLGGRYVSDKIMSRYAEWKLFTPLLMVNFGVAREFPNEPPFTSIVLRCPITIKDEEIDRIFIRIFNYSPRFAPPGRTVVQVEFETEWDYWNDLQREDRTGYDAEKERVASEVLKRMEYLYPGISSQVEVTDVATPYTFWRYTLNYEGTWEGWLMTPETINTQIERTLPGLDNFYMAGQWVMPGGGVPPCLYSGRHVVQLLCHRERKQFVTQLP